MSKSTEELLRELEAENVLPGGASGITARQTKYPRVAASAAGNSSAFMLVVAVLLVALVGSLPFGSLVLYPFTLLVTLIHETSHALAAVLTGGSVDSLSINSDLSGVTLTRGGSQALIASAGYLGATLSGVALLLVPVRRARWTLGALALVPLAALIAFHPANLFTAGWAVVFAVALAAAAWRLRPRLAAFLQIFLGAEAGLNAFRDLMTLIFINSSGAHIQTDADNMSNALFGPPILWAVLWTAVSLMLLIAALAVLLRRELPALRVPSLRRKQRRAGVVR